MRVLDGRQIGAMLDWDTTIGLVAQAMRLVSENETIAPLRWGMHMPAGGMLGMMPGYIARPACFGIKVVNIMPANEGTPYSSHSGCMLLFDAEHGQTLAMLDAGVITALRTAAASALATDLLARDDAEVLTVVGSGEQAAAHAEALCAVRNLREIRVCFRDTGRAGHFFEALRVPDSVAMRAFCDTGAALEGADVVCAVTSSPTPVIDEHMLAPGMHLNLVGACTRDRQEITTAALPLCRYFLDSRASAWDQAGELCAGLEQGVISDTFPRGEIGEVLLGTVSGRRQQSDITVYRSLGVAAQDLVVAQYLYERAVQDNLGTEIPF
ncbi:ornithine cyclodeaminase family protein [Parahaliea aestuarii]|uniref:Ornithine cyclodeaminase family protein n=1 Tax=Parahaliea aestuarii TaxID=1852021 RepID=A0A5C9A0J0_9GAMM|nr:ornithine cyclodeaminase family protein [Parahaliea aestuarii]TXS94383.1 ornithine cyclodeaminase family protein [Parahaliea aestuarii]